MSQLPMILDAIGRSLCYPNEHTVQAAELLFVALQGELTEAASAAAEFGAFVEPRVIYELEEAYTRTFDINPACALEVGWHLFGEEYARGLFLVRLRGEMQLRGVEESAELPDHIVHVLAVVAAMPHDEARRFVRACLLPAVDKMHKALDDSDSPYRHVIRCLAIVLEHEFGRSEASDDDQRETAAPKGDRLRDFPMPCGSPEPIDLVQIQTNPQSTPAPSALGDILQAARIGGHEDSIPDMLRDKLRHGESHG